MNSRYYSFLGVPNGEIYDFVLGEWRTVNANTVWYVDQYYVGVSVNGSMFWSAELEGDDLTRGIISFSSSQEEFIHIGYMNILPLRSHGGNRLTLLAQTLDLGEFEFWMSSQVSDPFIQGMKLYTVNCQGFPSILTPIHMFKGDKNVAVWIKDVIISEGGATCCTS
ncbi:unnamed protein product [Cochlearia groenlandica]